MAGGKETPRQKMIGMMYLVLTALLALNVSAEVLEAFGNITRGIDETIKVTAVKNAELYGLIQQRVSTSGDDENAKKVGERLKQVKPIIEDLDSYLLELKKKMVEEDGDQTWDMYINGSEDNDPLKLIDPKNIDVSTRILVEKAPNQPKSGGEELMEKINGTRTKLVALFEGLKGVDEAKKAELESQLTLRAEDDPNEKETAKKDWEYKTFNSIPRGAAIALLTKYQNDLQNAEGEVLKKLMEQISVGKLEVSELVPVVKLAKSALAVGEKVDAEIFLAARIGGVVPQISVDGKKIDVDPITGVGKYSAPASSQGSKKAKVDIQVVDTKTGESKPYPTVMEYEVFNSPAIVSADAMNVLYVGLDNPMSISVPGFEPDKVSATLSPSSVGTLVRGKKPGEYIAKIKGRSREGAKINVSVKTANGTISKGSTPFRTMNVPSPNAMLVGKSGGTISTGALKVANQVDVVLDGFVFEGIRYKATEFKYIYKPKRGNTVSNKAAGNRIPGDLKNAMNLAKPGDILIIYEIKASSPGLGQVQLKSALSFTVS